jgi:WD40 repeat protein
MIMASNLRKSILLTGIIAVAGLVANALGIQVMEPIQQTHGKLPVKLSKKFALAFPSGITAVAWSPDGAVLAAQSGEALVAFDSSGHQLSQFKSNGYMSSVNSLAFVNGSSQILFPIENVAKIDAALDIRDVATGHIVQTMTRVRDKVYSPNATKHLAVSPNQQRIAIATGVGQPFIVFGAADGKDWHELSVATGNPKLGATSLCFFPDSKLLAVGKDIGHFAVVDSTSGETIKELHAYDAPVEGYHTTIDAIAVSPKGDLILTGLGGGSISGAALRSPGLSSDFSGASIWRVSDGKQIASFADKDRLIRQAVWDPKNRFVAFVDNNNLFVWQPEAPDENFIRISYPYYTMSLSISPDGKSLAVGGGHNVIVYNIEDN